MGSTESTESAQRVEAPPGRAFMPIKEAAAALDVSEMTIRRAYAAGEIPGITIGRSCRVLVAFITALIALAETGQQVAVEDFGRQWKANGGGEAASRPVLAGAAS